MEMAQRLAVKTGWRGSLDRLMRGCDWVDDYENSVLMTSLEAKSERRSVLPESRRR